jgi:hypothetical protein
MKKRKNGVIAKRQKLEKRGRVEQANKVCFSLKVRRFFRRFLAEKQKFRVCGIFGAKKFRSLKAFPGQKRPRTKCKLYTMIHREVLVLLRTTKSNS